MIRCEKCKYYNASKNPITGWHYSCRNWGEDSFPVKPDGYCFRGKEKDSELIPEIYYGVTVKDTITGYVGRATAVATYWDTERVAYRVEGIDSTGRPVDDWIDSERLEVVDD